MSIKPPDRRQILNLFCLMLLFLAACQPFSPPFSPEAATPTIIEALPGAAPIAVGQPFTLSLGQQVFLPEANLHLRFERMLEDSRCPRQVLCEWAGEARATVIVWNETNPGQALEFSTFSSPPKRTDVHSFQMYTIQLKTVEPYPELPNQAIPKTAYRLTMVVIKIP